MTGLKTRFKGQRLMPSAIPSPSKGEAPSPPPVTPFMTAGGLARLKSYTRVALHSSNVPLAWAIMWSWSQRLSRARSISATTSALAALGAVALCRWCRTLALGMGWEGRGSALRQGRPFGAGCQLLESGRSAGGVMGGLQASRGYYKLLA